MRGLIFGAAGLLGREVDVELRRRGHLSIALDRSSADVTDPAQVTAAVAAHAPEVIFNCAAFTRVDDCERETALAAAVNGAAVGHLAAAARRGGAILVQVSTDYVFDGASRAPYREESPTRPLQVYGATKLEGERQALAWERSLVVRTSWLFGAGGPSFVSTMLRLLAEPAPVRVVDDQVGCPTYTPFLAGALIDLAANGARGIVHYRNADPVSWHGFAVEIARRSAPARRVEPISTAELPRPARRPAYSVLDVSRYELIVGRAVEPWSAGLDRCLPELLAARERAGAAPDAAGPGGGGGPR